MDSWSAIKNNFSFVLTAHSEKLVLPLGEIQTRRLLDNISLLIASSHMNTPIVLSKMFRNLNVKVKIPNCT